MPEAGVVAQVATFADQPEGGSDIAESQSI